MPCANAHEAGELAPAHRAGVAEFRMYSTPTAPGAAAPWGGVFLAERIVGVTLTNSDGDEVPVRPMDVWPAACQDPGALAPGAAISRKLNKISRILLATPGGKHGMLAV